MVKIRFSKDYTNFSAVNMALPEANLCVDPKLTPPTDLQAKLLRQIALSGLADHIARLNLLEFLQCSKKTFCVFFSISSRFLLS